jgi:hypothetical protein
MIDRTHEDDQLIIEQYERTIAEVKRETRVWQARYEELLCLYDERPEVQEVQKLQASLESSLALLQEDEQQMVEARALLEQAERLISSHDGDFSGWLTAFAAYAEKYPQEARE